MHYSFFFNSQFNVVFAGRKDHRFMNFKGQSQVWPWERHWRTGRGSLLCVKQGNGSSWAGRPKGEEMEKEFLYLNVEGD